MLAEPIAVAPRNLLREIEIGDDTCPSVLTGFCWGIVYALSSIGG